MKNHNIFNNIPTSITKRDETKEKFEPEKISIAISKAFINPSPEEIKDITDLVVSSLAQEVSVEDVQDAVEQTLIKLNYAEEAKRYILYRKQREIARESKSNLTNTFKELIFMDSADVDLKRENANIDGNSSMGMMLRIGSETNKDFTKKYILRPEHAYAHDNGDIHIHDLDFYNLTLNCCQISLKELFKKGFSTGHGYIREPNVIRTAAALTCIIIQSNQNDMFGGQSVPMFEYELAPYVVKTFSKELQKILEAKGIYLPQLKESIKSLYNRYGEVINRDEDLYFLLGSDKEIKHAIRLAKKYTENETYQAMEALVHNLNSMQSRAGAQVPFSSINYGTGTKAEERLIIRSILEATDAGLGNGETPIFPVQVFKVKDGINTKEGDPNYDLFQLSCKVSAKRLFPNYIFLDSPYNLQYYKGTPETEVSAMGCYLGDTVICVSRDNRIYYMAIKDFIARSDALSFKVWDSQKQAFVSITHLINNPPTSSWLRLKLSNGRVIEVTTDHLFPTKNKGLIRADELEIDDELVKGSFPPGSKVNTISDEQAWLLGMIIRDGCYASNTVTLCVGLDEKELIDKAADIYRKMGREVVIVKRHRGVKGNYYELRVKKSSDLCKYYKILFQGEKKSDRRIPLSIFNEVNAIYFLAGMFDADGHINIQHGDKSIGALGSTNETLSLQTMALAESLGLYTKIYCSKYGSKAKSKRVYSCNIALKDFFVDSFVCLKKIKQAKERSYAVFTDTDTLKVAEIIPLDIYEKSYCLQTETGYFDANGIYAHNCRTRVIGNINGDSVVTGRGNIAFVTINLPRLGIKHRGHIDSFYKELTQLMEMCYDQLIDRYNFIAKKHVYNFPFLMEQGVWHKSSELELEDTIEPVLKHGTLSIGFIGLAECLKALIGKHHGESEDAQKLGLEIISYMRKLTDEMTDKSHLNFSLFATPAEGVSGRFTKIDKKLYGIIPGVTDREYYTNSSHIPVYYPITAARKIELEAPYHELCNAGVICYVECDGNLMKNTKAFENIILYMKRCNIHYGSINHPVDRCPVCGYTGVINDVCPKCGRHDGEGVSVEKLKEIGVKL